MLETLLPLLTAPGGGEPLMLASVSRRDGAEIITACLTDAAGQEYPVEDGIPRLLPRDLLDAQKSEIVARDAQVEDYDRMAFLNLFGKVEIPLTERHLGAKSSDRLLEAGCGTGRMTRTLAHSVHELIAMDFSFESLRVNQRKLRAAGIHNVHLVQADLCRLPFADTAFDRVVSCQVLEHVPGETARTAAVASLSRVTQPGGTLVLSAYQHSVFTRLFAQKEGAHEGGIPYFRFTRQELSETLSQGFTVEVITSRLVYIYLARCRKNLG